VTVRTLVNCGLKPTLCAGQEVAYRSDPLSRKAHATPT
jgi:hypothetical protein